MKNVFSSLIILLFSGNCSFGQIPAQTLPEFEFSRLDKSAFTNKNLPHGKLLFFVFFDSDCDHCQRAVKNLDKQYKSFKKASVYLISLDDQDKINRFMIIYGHN